MNGDPFVSVILSTYNGESRVLNAIRSVLAQDYGNFELVVVDDGSQDRTGEMIESVQDPRLVHLTMPSNAGLYAARSRAIDSASGEIIAFIDDDDEWLPGKLTRQVEFLKRNPEVALVHGSVIDVFPSGAQHVRTLHHAADSYRENLSQDRVATSTVMLRKAVFYEVGAYDTSVRAFGDWDLWVRVMRAHKVVAIREPLAIIHLREGSIQRGSVERFEQYRRIAIEKHRDELRDLKLERLTEGRHQYAVAAKLQQQGRSAEARSRALLSLRSRPSMEAFSLLMLTFLPDGLAHRARLLLRRTRSVLRL